MFHVPVPNFPAYLIVTSVESPRTNELTTGDIDKRKTIQKLFLESEVIHFR